MHFLLSSTKQGGDPGIFSVMSVQKLWTILYIFGQVGWLEIGTERDYFNMFKIILPEQAINSNQPKKFIISKGRFQILDFFLRLDHGGDR